MALVGLGAAAYTACSIHGFVPHAALGVEVGSPILASVKVDISRMASNVASGVGFIGAGCIHKARLRGGGDGTDDDERNAAAAGLATAAAVWVSAAAGVASGAGLYGVAAATTFATVAILGYAPRGPEDGEGDVVVDERRRRTRTALVEAGGDRLLDDGGGRSRPRRRELARERRSTGRDQGSVPSGLFGKQGDNMGNDYNAENNASYVDQYGLYDRYSRDIHPIIIKEIIDPRFKCYLGLLSRLGDNDADGIAAANDQQGGRPAESSP